MKSTPPKISASFGLVLAAILSACSSSAAGDAVGAQQATSPAPTPTEGATPGGEGDAEPEQTDNATAADEPETDDGPTTIGGEETGLTLEIPDEWVELPKDAGAGSEAAAGNLDLTDDQAVLVEWWTAVLPNLDGAVTAVDSSTMTASVATITNAVCAPNDGRIGRQPGVEASPLQENDLEEMTGLAIWDTFGPLAEDLEVESTTVAGHPAARGAYTLDMTEAAGVAAGAAGVGVQYMLLADDDICWVTFTGAEESSFGLFDDIAATISVL